MSALPNDSQVEVRQPLPVRRTVREGCVFLRQRTFAAKELEALEGVEVWVEHDVHQFEFVHVRDEAGGFIAIARRAQAVGVHRPPLLEQAKGAGFDAVTQQRHEDRLIRQQVARGQVSAQPAWAFNEEQLRQAMARYMSATGHGSVHFTFEYFLAFLHSPQAAKLRIGGGQ